MQSHFLLHRRFLGGNFIIRTVHSYCMHMCFIHLFIYLFAVISLSEPPFVSQSEKIRRRLTAKDRACVRRRDYSLNEHKDIIITHNFGEKSADTAQEIHFCSAYASSRELTRFYDRAWKWWQQQQVERENNGHLPFWAFNQRSVSEATNVWKQQMPPDTR